MKTIIFSGLMTLISVTLSAQTGAVMQSLNDFYSGFRTAKFIHGDDMNVGIEGSPCDKSEFVPSELKTIKNEQYNGVPMRYNIYSDHVEFKDETGQVLYFGEPDLVDHVLIGDRKYVYVPYKLGSRILKGYFAELADGSVTLLLKMNMILKPAEKPAAYKDAEPAKFVRTPDDFYIRILPDDAVLVKGKKELKELLPTWPAELDDYLKKNKVRFTNEKELTQFISYYNSLAEK